MLAPEALGKVAELATAPVLELVTLFDTTLPAVAALAGDRVNVAVCERETVPVNAVPGPSWVVLAMYPVSAVY